MWPTLAPAAEPTTPSTPHIIVEGQGVVHTPPDLATISFTLRGEGHSSDEAVSALVAERKTIDDAVTRSTPDKDWQDGKIAIHGVKDEACKDHGDDDSDRPRLSAGACAIIGYVAEVGVTLKTKSVKDAATLVGLIGRLGGREPSIDSYDLVNPRAAQALAMVAALTDAQATAEAMTKSGQMRLGKVLEIINPDARGYDEVVVTALKRADRPSPDMVVPPLIAVALTPAPIDTSAKVTVTYELLP